MPISSASSAATSGPAPPNATMRNRGASTPRRASTFEASAAISAIATRIAPSATASTDMPSGPANAAERLARRLHLQRQFAAEPLPRRQQPGDQKRIGQCRRVREPAIP